MQIGRLLFGVQRMRQLLLQDAVALSSSRNPETPDVFGIAASTNLRFSFALPLGLRLIPLSHLLLDGGQVTRVRIRAPFDGEIISLKTTRHFNTINNVKAKVDNVKAKIQDKQERGPWSRPTLARRPVLGQLAASPTSFPLDEPLSASHDKSPPRTRSPAPTSTRA
jgi:hypothetical protein